MSRAYDRAGRRVALTYPDGSVVHEGRDGLGRLTSLAGCAGCTDPAQAEPLWQGGHHGVRPGSRTLPSGLALTPSYTAAGLPGGLDGSAADGAGVLSFADTFGTGSAVHRRASRKASVGLAWSDRIEHDPALRASGFGQAGPPLPGVPELQARWGVSNVAASRRWAGRQRLLGDGERLDQDRHVPQRPRHDVHVALVVDHQLRHEAVQAVYAALGEVPGEAEILPPGAARRTVRVRAGTAHHRNDEVTRREPRDSRAHLDDLTERFVADHQAGLSHRRRPVLEGADLPVGAADTDVEHAELHLGRLAHAGDVVNDQCHLALPGDDENGLHAGSMPAGPGRLPGAALRRLPIPILDGGHMVFLGIEDVRRKPLNEKVIMVAQRAGLVIIITLMVFAFYNDIMRLVTGKMIPQ